MQAQFSVPPKDMDLGTLLTVAEHLSAKHADGHLTLLRFTTHWKVVLGTPDLDIGDARNHVLGLQAYPSLREALIALIEQPQALP